MLTSQSLVSTSIALNFGVLTSASLTASAALVLCLFVSTPAPGNTQHKRCLQNLHARICACLPVCMFLCMYLYCWTNLALCDTCIYKLWPGQMWVWAAQRPRWRPQWKGLSEKGLPLWRKQIEKDVSSKDPHIFHMSRRIFKQHFKPGYALLEILHIFWQIIQM